MDSYINNKFQQRKCKKGRAVKKDGQTREEIETPHVNPNKLILGETKLIFWPTGRTAKKNWVGWSIGKIEIILFDS